MLQLDMLNKEQLLYFFLSNNIKLSTYDYKFMANLQTMLQKTHRVTSNQSNLFTNLIDKYKKQLTKNKLDVDSLKKLEWKNRVVESTAEYTGANLSIQDDELILKVPYNYKFIKEINQTKDNGFVWDNINKIYRSPFSTNSLKIINSLLPKHFYTINYDEQLENIFIELESYNGKQFTPTLYLINDRPVIAPINEVLEDKIKNIDLVISSNVLYELSLLGITIDPEVYKENPELEFASNNLAKIEVSDFEYALQWMKKLKCENVFIHGGFRPHLTSDEVKSLVLKYGMNPRLDLLMNANSSTKNTMLITFSSRILPNNINLQNASPGKIIVFKSSNPIEIS